jgi:tRNA-dihydrouridine synthase B
MAAPVKLVEPCSNRQKTILTGFPEPGTKSHFLLLKWRSDISKPTDHFYLAPMRGLTDVTYRNTWSRHFNGFDGAVAPFISTVQGNRIPPKVLSGLLPGQNTGLPVIPQIIGNRAADFIRLAGCLFDLGYKTVNWNLGCPWPMVAKKARGSGLLPYPDRIRDFLEQVLPAIPGQLSIKTRLGRFHAREMLELIPVLNRFALAEVIVHPRTGIQMYEGTVDLNGFETCLAQLVHPVVYNGDITTVDGFKALTHRFPSVSRWMIGRGALADPFLPAALKTGSAPDGCKTEKICRFHDELVAEYRRIFSGPSHLLQRMKGLWKYLARSFENGGAVLKKIQKTQRLKDYEQLVAHFFKTEARWVA